jgi:hypothetical protein
VILSCVALASALVISADTSDRHLTKLFAEYVFHPLVDAIEPALQHLLHM